MTFPGWEVYQKNRGFRGKMGSFVEKVGFLLKTGEFYEISEGIKSGDVYQKDGKLEDCGLSGAAARTGSLRQ